jgi:hypothetical protein
VDVVDNGEAGSNDTFRIQLNNGYDASGTLGGGNVQVHSAAAVSASQKPRIVDSNR